MSSIQELPHQLTLYIPGYIKEEHTTVIYCILHPVDTSVLPDAVFEEVFVNVSKGMAATHNARFLHWASDQPSLKVTHTIDVNGHDHIQIQGGPYNHITANRLRSVFRDLTTIDLAIVEGNPNEDR